MSREKRPAAQIFLLALAALSAQAQQRTVDLDPAKTQINWSLAGNVHTTHGVFQLKSGHLVLDLATGSITGGLVVDASSGDSGSAARDKKMNKEVLESDKFPEFRFTPQKVQGSVLAAGHSSVRVSGLFLIHGATHALTIPIDLSVNQGSLTASARFSIPYVDWGMKNPSNFLFKVDQSVEVEVIAKGQIGLPWPAPK